MKLLFVITGVGLGDATREHANIEAFLRRDPSTEIIIAGYDNSYEYFKAKFTTVRIRGYKLLGKKLKFSPVSFVLRNFLLPFVWFWETIKLRMLIKRFNPDIIISDFEPTGLIIAKLAKKKCVMIFGYDPLIYEEFVKKHKVSKIMMLEHKYLTGIYKRADFAIVQTLRNRKHSMIYNYVDPIVRQTPDDLPSEKILMRMLGLKKQPILVMLGGSEYGLKLAREVDYVASKLKNENFIIFGASKIMPKSPNVVHYPFKEEILEYLKASKGVISLAGQKSLTEAIVFKKPILVMPIADHIEQALNAFSLEDIAMVCWKTETREMRKSILDFVHNIPELKRKMQHLNIKANGSEEVVKYVYGLLQR